MNSSSSSSSSSSYTIRVLLIMSGDKSSILRSSHIFKDIIKLTEYLFGKLGKGPRIVFCINEENIDIFHIIDWSQFDSVAMVPLNEMRKTSWRVWVERRHTRILTMKNNKKINVAVVGLGFGAEFIPLWQKHPHTNCYAICQRNKAKLNAVGDYFGVEQRYSDFGALLKDRAVDVVHINSPIPDHAWMSIAARKAGKYVACTVPMATNIADCRKIVDLAKRTGLKYMMMETVVYAREYLFMKELLDQGELGKLQFVQASHQQDSVIDAAHKIAHEVKLAMRLE